jgi:ketosteroid isomerase-like protein
VLIIALIFSCQQITTTNKEKIEAEIMAVLDDQVRYWNQGDIEKYMNGYNRSDSLRFASGGKISYGWETTLEHYKEGYPNKSAMGVLIFSEIDMTIIARDAALVFGKWELQKENENPWGLFTLLFRKTKDGWRIVHDHTSSAEN